MQVLIEADSGGSNSARSRVWTRCLQERVADQFGLTVTVWHDPPGASQWNPLDHRLFSEISTTWAGWPLRSFATGVGYSQETRTQTGLQGTAHRVPTTSRTGGKVPQAGMATLAIQPHDVCPQWNHTIHPRPVGIASYENAEGVLL
jgi:hypothetical protein